MRNKTLKRSNIVRNIALINKGLKRKKGKKMNDADKKREKEEKERYRKARMESDNCFAILDENDNVIVENREEKKWNKKKIKKHRPDK